MRNQTATQLLFEMSKAGRGTIVFPESDVPDVALTASDRRRASCHRPAAAAGNRGARCRAAFCESVDSEHECRFALLSARQLHDEVQPQTTRTLARLPQAATSHPYQPEDQIQGLLSILFEMQGMLAEISGTAGRFTASRRRRSGRIHSPADRRRIFQGSRGKSHTSPLPCQRSRDESRQCRAGWI